MACLTLYARAARVNERSVVLESPSVIQPTVPGISENVTTEISNMD